MKSEFRKKALKGALDHAGMAIRIKLYNLAKKDKPASKAEVAEPEPEVEVKSLSEDEIEDLEKYLG